MRIAHVTCYGDEARDDRLRWFGHIQRRDSDHLGSWRRPGCRTEAKLRECECTAPVRKHPLKTERVLPQ